MVRMRPNQGARVVYAQLEISLYSWLTRDMTSAESAPVNAWVASDFKYELGTRLVPVPALTSRLLKVLV